MSDQNLQSWLKQTVDAMEPFHSLMSCIEEENVALDDTFGWGARLQHIWEKSPDPPCGLLLTGPDGCGKHTAATHMAYILYENYYPVMLNGLDFCADGYATARARMLRVIRSYAEEDKPLCLIMEGLESCGFRRELLTCLGQVLNAAWMQNPEEPSLFVILIDANDADIPSILRSRLRLCRMSLPSDSQRSAFFQRKEFSMIRSSANLELLVQSTAGLTYAQLVDLAWNLESTIHCTVKVKQEFTDADLEEFLQGQTPGHELEDPLRSLARSARQFIEHLPELMKHMGTAVKEKIYRQDADAEPNTTKKTEEPAIDPKLNADEKEKMKKKMEQEIMDMRTKDLSMDLFGAERMKKINALRQPA